MNFNRHRFRSVMVHRSWEDNQFPNKGSGSENLISRVFCWVDLHQRIHQNMGNTWVILWGLPPPLQKNTWLKKELALLLGSFVTRKNYSFFSRYWNEFNLCTRLTNDALGRTNTKNHLSKLWSVIYRHFCTFLFNNNLVKSSEILS